jgi:TusA-related sulfurtransferase
MSELTPGEDVGLGKQFLAALADRDFSQVEAIFQPQVRFRTLAPSGLRESASAEGAVKWLQYWFGDADELEILRLAIDQIADRLYLTYRLRLRNADRWRIIEQHAFCCTEEGRISDIALLCSGFHAVPNENQLPKQRKESTSMSNPTQTDRSFFNADLIYDAGDKGCAEGPMNEIARLMRQLSAGQTLEVHAIDPSVAGDLPAWCRLAGHEFVKQEGDHYLIRRK